MSIFPRAWPPKSLPNEVLEGARVILQPPHKRDWQDWAQVRARNEAYLRPFEPQWPEDCLTRSFFDKRLKRQRTEWTGGRARYFLIRLRENRTLIGGVNLNNLQFGAARCASLGYWIDEAYQGQGLMRESLFHVLDYAFRTLRLQRIHAACVPENERSKRLLKSIGLCEEGFAREYLEINGQWRDHHLYGIIRADYARPVSLESAAGSIPKVA